MTPFPDKKYDVIYADPPWEAKGMTLNGSKTKRSNPATHYATMTLGDICDLPVSSLASRDCLLFVWATGVNLADAIAVGGQWGFEYKTIGFVWYKEAFAPAHYTLSECELCLLFKRGRVPCPRGKRNIRQFLSCKRGRHSEKPWEIRQRITEMFPTQSKIELFARTPELLQPASGWDVWGNEA